MAEVTIHNETCEETEVSEITVLTSDVQDEITILKEEYLKLQDYLAQIEVKHQIVPVINQSEYVTDMAGSRKEMFLNNLNMFVVKLFNKPHYSDMEILMKDGQQIYGHKLILASRSENWGEQNILQSDSLDLSDFSYDVAYAVIKWVYTDEINLLIDYVLLIEILKMGLRFQLDALCFRCEKALISVIDSCNCEQIYQSAEELSAKVLKDFCSEVIMKIRKVDDNDDGNVEMSEDKPLPKKRPRKRNAKKQTKLYLLLYIVSKHS